MRLRLAVASVALAVSLIVLAATAVAAPARTARATDHHYVMKVLVRGAPLRQANGIWADGQRLYVATVAGNQIAVLDARNGHVIRRIPQASSDDVTMGPDGSLYWTDLLEGQVARMAPDGTVTRQAVAPGVNPITFSADGRLFVAQAILPLGDALYELDPALQDPPTLIWSPGDGYPFLQQLNGFDFGPDGMLYAPQPYLGQIVRLDLGASVITPQVVATGLSFPTAVKFDSYGRLFAVAAEQNGQVLRIDVSTGKVGLVSTVPTGLAGMDNLAFGPGDRLYCTGGADGSVWQILPSGHARNLSPGGVNIPTSVVAARSKRPGHRVSLYVGNVFSYFKFDARTGRVLDTQWQHFGGGALTMPFTLGAYGRDLVLTSYFANSVQVWNPRTKTSVDEWFDLPVPVNAIGFGRDLVIATIGGGGQVIRQAPDGTRTAFPAHPGIPLYLPSGLAATRDDLWVADWATGIVWQLVTDGAALDPPRPVAFDLAGPEGLAVDRDGSLLVVETNAQRLTRIDPATGAASVVATGLRVGIPPSPSYLPYSWFSGVAVDRSGAIYVTGDEGAVVYRLKPVRHH